MYKINKKIIISICIFIIAVLFSKSVQAASASISADKEQASVGDEITITTTIKGAAWQITLSGAVSESYADNTDDAEDTTLTKKVSFKPTKADTYTVSMSGNVTGSTDSSSTPVGGSVKITVKDKEGSQNPTSKENEDSNQKESATSTNNAQSETKKSSNANLSDLGIKPNDFKGFKPSIESYDVTVPNNVEKIEVYAKTQDSNAKYSVEGNRNLKEGKNTFNIKVTAEDGTKKTYTINVTREETKTEDNSKTDKEAENERTNETTETVTTSTETPDLNKLVIVGYKISPEFSPSVYEYKLDVPLDVTSLDVKTEASNENVQVEVAGNTELKDGENVITVNCYNKETKKNTTYQIIVDKKSANSTENPHQEAINEAKKKRDLIIKIGIALIIILIILCVIVFKKGKEENIELEYKEKKKENIKKDEKVINPNEDKANIPSRKKITTLTEEDEYDAKHGRVNITSNEEIPKSLKNEKVAKIDSNEPKKTQQNREAEFDEKLNRIRREKRIEKKGGKHF